MMPHSDPTPSNPFDVSREKWVTLRHLSVMVGLVAIVWMMCDCSGKWLDEAYREPVKVDSAGVVR